MWNEANIKFSPTKHIGENSEVMNPSISKKVLFSTQSFLMNEVQPETEILHYQCLIDHPYLFTFLTVLSPPLSFWPLLPDLNCNLPQKVFLSYFDLLFYTLNYILGWIWMMDNKKYTRNLVRTVILRNIYATANVHIWLHNPPGCYNGWLTPCRNLIFFRNQIGWKYYFTHNRENNHPGCLPWLILFFLIIGKNNSATWEVSANDHLYSFF